MSDPTVADAVNEARGGDLDPLEMLITFEERAAALWKIEKPSESQQSFVDIYVAIAIDNL